MARSLQDQGTDKSALFNCSESAESCKQDTSQSVAWQLQVESQWLLLDYSSSAPVVSKWSPFFFCLLNSNHASMILKQTPFGAFARGYKGKQALDGDWPPAAALMDGVH